MAMQRDEISQKSQPVRSALHSQWKWQVYNLILKYYTFWSHFILRSNFFLNKLLICCLLIFIKVKISGRIRDVEYGHVEYVLYKY